MPIQTGLIPNAHSDLVTDATYDFYGLKLATCSLDQKIKIWSVDEATGAWTVEDSWNAHSAPISKLSWAHPEFGMILASGGFDKTVKIWERAIITPSTETEESGLGRWIERGVLVDARGTIRAVEFSPRHFGLKLATLSTDNFLRIYECLDQSSQSQASSSSSAHAGASMLWTWHMTEEIDVLALTTANVGTPSYTSRSGTMALATPTQTYASLDSPGASANLVAQALQQASSANASSPIGVSSVVGVPGRFGLGTREADGGWCLSWCKDRYRGEVIAVGCGISPVVKIVQIAPSRRPIVICVLDPAPAPALPQNSPDDSSEVTPTATTSGALPVAGAGPSRAKRAETGKKQRNNTSDPSQPAASYSITSVAWAPSCGRSYDLIATGSRDGKVRIWRVKAGDSEAEPKTGGEMDVDGFGAQGEEEEGEWTASLVGEFGEHKSAIGRVDWNVTGTTLASTANDGRVRLWKASALSGSVMGVWRGVGSVGVEMEEPQESKTQEDSGQDVEMR
ncbi:WD40 repeat-like protein [Mycena floridula]|nr:WD40 repeat-like protein [Mycena floridula]